MCTPTRPGLIVSRQRTQHPGRTVTEGSARVTCPNRDLPNENQALQHALPLRVRGQAPSAAAQADEN
jgi:hypothetical protein